MGTVNSPGSGRLLKLGILLFWCVWISVVVTGNTFDLLKTLGLLPAGWGFASGNYGAIVKTTDTFGLPHLLDRLLYVGVILWEGAAMVLFWMALANFRGRTRGQMRAVYLAFISLLALFATFILSDELFHRFKLEGDHRSIALLLLASLLALQLLPDAPSRER